MTTIEALNTVMREVWENILIEQSNREILLRQMLGTDSFDPIEWEPIDPDLEMDEGL